MRMIATRRIADIVVAIMAQGHIDDTTLGKMLQTIQMTIECQTVLNAQHDTFAPLLLIGIEVGRRTSYS